MALHVHYQLIGFFLTMVVPFEEALYQSNNLRSVKWFVLSHNLLVAMRHLHRQPLKSGTERLTVSSDRGFNGFTLARRCSQGGLLSSYERGTAY